TPGDPHKAAAFAEMSHHLIESGQLERVVALEFQSALVEPRLKLVELASHALGEAGHGDAHPLARQAIDHLDLSRVDVAGADVQPDRNAFQLPVGVLVAGALVTPVDTMPDAVGLELLGPAFDVSLDLRPAGLITKDGDDDHLDGRDLRWNDKSRVIAMGHHERSDQARAHAP